MSSLWFGVDLSQTALGIVAATPEIVARGEWGAMNSITIGEPGHKSDSDEDRARRTTRLVDAAVNWMQTVWVKSHETDGKHVVFEAYPMGAGALHGIDRVAEVGGHLRCEIWRRMDTAPSSAPIASARKLLTGGLTKSMIAVCHNELTPGEVRKLGRDKGAVWGYLRRLGVTEYLQTPDEGDAFVALNWGLHQAGLPCLAGQEEA